MNKRLLDLFCGVGGAGEGYQQAGFEVTGVDNLDQPNNPHKFILDDALEYLIKYGNNYDVIHASPPCQKYSVATYPYRKEGKEYADFIEPIRNVLIQLGIPYIIENVPLAPIRNDVVLRGYVFNLRVIRERVFELGNGLFMLQEEMYKTDKQVKKGDFVSVFGNGSLKFHKNDSDFKEHKGSILNNWRFAMGIPWAKTYKELANAIPPAYTKYIGEQIYNQI